IMMGPETAAHHDLIIRFGGPLAWSQHLNSAGMGAGLASVRIHESPELPRLQGKLRENLALFDSLIGTEQSGDDFSIRMVVIGSEAAAADASGKIFERGFYTSPVFFPIVERGKAGLRVMLRADNRPEDIRTFCELVRDAVELD
ncbi:MAG TPA: hypothetical protein VEL74_03205, partial [Thermoanaerobaculia bacterium]|nr:hypothetical protein [Thermoanaerobaculia bacterium]